MSDNDVLARLRELLSKATPGPWSPGLPADAVVTSVRAAPHFTDAERHADYYGGHLIAESMQRPDRDLIAAMRNALPALLDELERLLACESELDRVGKAIPSVEWMDPPDGGSVTLSEQVSRMASEIERLRAAPAGVPEELATFRATLGNVTWLGRELSHALDLTEPMDRTAGRLLWLAFREKAFDHAARSATAQRDSEAVGYARGVEAMREAAAKACEAMALARRGRPGELTGRAGIRSIEDYVCAAAIRSAPLPTVEGE